MAINLPILETTTNSLNGSVVIVKEPARPIPATASLGFDYPCYNAVDGNHGGAEVEGFRIKNGDHGMRDGNHYSQDVDRYMEWGLSEVWPGGREGRGGKLNTKNRLWELALTRDGLDPGLRSGRSANTFVHLAIRNPANDSATASGSLSTSLAKDMTATDGFGYNLKW